MTSQVSLVGGGPGDPGLLTLRAEAQLAAAALVIVDRPLLEVAAGRAPRARLVMVEEGASAVTELLASVAAGPGPIVRLYRGDPWLHPAHRAEAAALRAAGVAVEAVPGVATEVALPALAGVPLHARPLAVTATLTAPETAPPSDDPARTLVVTAPDLRAAAARLLAAAGPSGGSCPAALVPHAGGVVRGTLAALSAAAPAAPGLLVNGAVCALDTRGRLDTRGASGA